jgi:UDP-N-acetylmuramyl pentapeptide synthase
MVIEIGMNAPGEIKKLSDITCADVSVVTEVAPAHIGAFSCIEDIGIEKLSIVSGAKNGTPFIVNGDNPIIEKLIPQLGLDKNYNIITVGENPKNHIRVDNIKADGLDNISFRYNEKIDFNVSIPGVHNAKNAAIACAAIQALWPQVTDKQLQDGLARFIAPLMRLNLKATKKGLPILDDSYNANPASMNAMLAIANDAKRSGKKIGLVVGTMREMGKFAKKYHNELGQNISKLNPELVILVGEHSLDVKDGMTSSSESCQVFVADNAEHAAKIVEAEFRGDMLFVKGSRGIGLDKTVELLIK